MILKTSDTIVEVYVCLGNLAIIIYDDLLGFYQFFETNGFKKSHIYLTEFTFN